MKNTTKHIYKMTIVTKDATCAYKLALHEV